MNTHRPAEPSKTICPANRLGGQAGSASPPLVDAVPGPLITLLIPADPMMRYVCGGVMTFRRYLSNHIVDDGVGWAGGECKAFMLSLYM